MEPWLDFGLDASRWLQESYPQLGAFLAAVSDIGRFEFYLALLPLIYWCIDKRAGKHLTYLLAVSDLLNHTLKQAFRAPRPYWLDDSLALAEEGGYGIPSGHVQSATIFYLGLASWVQRRWAWWLAVAMVLLMALSRVYLGDHFLLDAVAGLAVGLLLLAGYWTAWGNMEKPLTQRILGQRLLVAILVPVLLIGIYVAIRLSIGPADLSGALGALRQVAEQETLESVTSAFGTLLGLGIGFTLERSWVRFRVAGSPFKKAARYLLGIAIVILIWRGLGLAFAGIDVLWLALPLRALRYFLMSLWATYYAPAVFVRLGLAVADPEPEIQISLSHQAPSL